MQPLIYSIINKQHLEDLLEPFYQCLNLPVQLLDALQERSPSLSGHTRRMGKRYCRSLSEW